MVHRAIILGAACLAAAALAAAAAGAQVADWIKIGPSAELVDSTTLDVTVTYSCLAFDGAGEGSVEVAEDTAFGIFFPALCDDRSHTETIEITGLWTPGSASAHGQVCGDDAFCGDNF